MTKRRKTKKHSNVQKLLTPIHQKLYPPLTEERKSAINDDLKRDRNIIARSWRHIEDYPLGIHHAKQRKTEYFGWGFTLEGLCRETLEDDRRSLRIRLLIWISLISLLIWSDSYVAAYVTGGVLIACELYKRNWQFIKQRGGYPGWKPMSLMGHMIQTVLVEIVYIFSGLLLWAFLTGPQ